MNSPSRSSERALPLVSALVLLGGLTVFGLLGVFPQLRAPHPEFGMAAWLLLAACIGCFPLSSGLLSTATRRAPLVVRARRRRSAALVASLAAEHVSTRSLRAARRPGRSPLPVTVALS